jgi:uncharacterized protein DUF2567
MNFLTPRPGAPLAEPAVLAGAEALTTVAPVVLQQAPEPVPFRPGAVVRADVVPAWGVLCAVAVLGLPLGALWSWLAPTEFVVRSALVAAPGGVLPFAGQTEHRFDDMAIFVLLGLATGVLTGAALWLLRRRRGPLVLLAAVLGSLIAAWLAMRIGLWLVAARYPDLASTGAPFPRPPVLESAWVIITQPFGVAVTYCITTAWSGTDDLSSGLA